MKKTKLCRIETDLAEQLESTWPDMTMSDRLRNIYDLSIAKVEVGLRKRR